MTIYVFSRHAIEAARPHDVPHIFISITTDDIPAKLPINHLTQGILRLQFSDVDSGEHAFTRAQAEQIWDLYEAHKDVDILVHCDAGYSRSPAVAAAISKTLTDDDAEYFRRYRPNMLVYKLVLYVGMERYGISV